MNRKISPEMLQEVVRMSAEGLQLEQIILFGSNACRQPIQTSDLDLMIIVSGFSEPDHRREQKAYACVSAIEIPKDYWY